MSYVYIFEPYYRLVVPAVGQPVVYSDGPRSRGRALAPQTSRKGYLRVMMGCLGLKQLHALVAEAVYGPRPLNMVVNHKDGNKLNNRPENLEYCTNADNIRHARALGLFPARGTNFKHGRTADRAEYERQWRIDNADHIRARSKAYRERRQINTEA